MAPSEVPMEVIRRERAARVTAMFERWASDDISDEPDWDIDQIERLGFRHDARTADS